MISFFKQTLRGSSLSLGCEQVLGMWDPGIRLKVGNLGIWPFL